MTDETPTAIQKELQPLITEVVSFKDKAESLVIKDDTDYAATIELAGIVTEKKKSIEAMRVFFTAPLNEQVKNINGMFKPQIEEADQIISILKGKMSVYFTKKEEARIKEEKRLQDIRDAADAKRAENGKEAIAEPIREVATVAKTVSSGSAQSTVRKVWKHEVLSMTELPEDVKKAIFAEAFKKGIVDTVVRKFVSAGIREMTGVRIYEDNEIAIKRG